MSARSIQFFSDPALASSIRSIHLAHASPLAKSAVRLDEGAYLSFDRGCVNRRHDSSGQAEHEPLDVSSAWGMRIFHQRL